MHDAEENLARLDSTNGVASPGRIEDRAIGSDSFSTD
jgi:hypothetical protein